MLDGVIIGGIAGGAAVFLFVLLQPQRKCPNCGEPLPKFRKPTNKRQAVWGGWTCPNCNAEIDRKGKLVTP